MPWTELRGAGSRPVAAPPHRGGRFRPARVVVLGIALQPAGVGAVGGVGAAVGVAVHPVLRARVRLQEALQVRVIRARPQPVPAGSSASVRLVAPPTCALHPDWLHP